MERARALDQVEISRFGYGVEAIFGAQFFEDVVDVGLGSPPADDESCGDLSVGEALCYEAQDLQLASAQEH